MTDVAWCEDAILRTDAVLVRAALLYRPQCYRRWILLPCSSKAMVIICATRVHVGYSR